jgi:hypothetical protein
MSKVPKGILAFRSITTLISIIQQGTFTHPSGKEVTTEDSRQALVLSVAFSILAALEYEVVAVVAKQNLRTLEVIICSNLPCNKDRTFVQWLSDFVFSRNDRWSDGDTDTKCQYPAVILPLAPEGLKGSEDLQGYIASLW